MKSKIIELLKGAAEVVKEALKGIVLGFNEAEKSHDSSGDVYYDNNDYTDGDGGV